MEDFFSILNYQPKQPEIGKVLLSEPLLDDPFFRRSVILLAENNEEGTIGFMLNKTINVNVNDIIKDFPKVNAEVYWGGPVNRNHLFYVHTRADLLDYSKEILPGLYWGGDFEQLKMLLDTNQISPSEIRFFAGYSGWEKGQLKQEMDEKSWIVAKTNVKSLMHASRKNMWKNILSKLGRKFQIMSAFPEDHSLN